VNEAPVPGKRIQLTREHLAHHEAGHAVAGFVLGFELGAITIKGEEDAHAIVTNPLRGWKRGDGPRRQLARRYALALYAGAAAERLLPEQAAPWYDDFDKARRWLKQYAAPPAARLAGQRAYRRQEESLRARALNLVRRYRPAITRLAQVLLERGEVAKDQSEALVRRLVESTSGRSAAAAREPKGGPRMSQDTEGSWTPRRQLGDVR
jgi:hypothetical protein